MTAPANVFVYTVKQYIDPAQLKVDLSYSSSDLTGAMMTQASLFAHYGMLSAQCSRQADAFKMLLETAEASVSRRLRDEAALQGVKTTEPGLAAAVAKDPKILSLKKALNEAKQIDASGKIAVEGFRHRRDMLVQHGLISREEMKGEISIQAKRIQDEEREHQKERFLNRNKSNQDQPTED